MMNQKPEQYVFFLGGHDLEMVTIRELLRENALGRFHDKGLGWGAKASAYRAEIADTLTQGKTPVLLELDHDLSLDPNCFVLVDHHGARAGAAAPTSLQQVFALLQLPPEKWTRWHTLVAANDRGYIPEMLAVGATADELRQVRAADRSAQGITAEQEQAAALSIAERQVSANGKLTIVHLPHSRTAAVADRMESALGGPGFQNLVIVSPAEINFFGAGEIVQSLAKRFPGGWCGGALPRRGFWGLKHPGAEVVPFITAALQDAA